MMGLRRKCSQCGKTGHNSRTCRVENGQSTKLFGVELVSRQGPSQDDGSFGLRKSVNFTSAHDQSCDHKLNHRQMRKKGKYPLIFQSFNDENYVGVMTNGVI